MAKMNIEYWKDGEWLVGRLKGIPGVFSQGKTIEDLVANIKDAYQMMLEADDEAPESDTQLMEIDIAV